jgi:glycosyltransferase involved in cell wall biosynthesis
VDLLVRAVARLKDEIRGMSLRIVGDGDLVPTLERQARALGIADRVAFDGPVSLDRIPAIVRASWVGAQPHPEDPLIRLTLPTKVLEWCALGLPVICSRTDALARTLSGEDIVMLEPGNIDDLCRALLDAHRDPESLARRAAHARETVRRFDWSRERRRLLAVANAARS